MAARNRQSSVRPEPKSSLDKEKMNEKLKTKLNSLPEEDKRIIELAWERHRKACERTKVGPDPQFLEVAVEEMRAGRNILVAS